MNPMPTLILLEEEIGNDVSYLFSAIFSEEYKNGVSIDF